MATHSNIPAWRTPMDRGAWLATVHRIAKSQTRLEQRRSHVCILPSLLSQRKSFSKNEANKEKSRAKRYLTTTQEHLDPTTPEGRTPRLLRTCQQIPLCLNQLELGLWFLRPRTYD